MVRYKILPHPWSNASIDLISLLIFGSGKLSNKTATSSNLNSGTAIVGIESGIGASSSPSGKYCFSKSRTSKNLGVTFPDSLIGAS